ncbi:MAG TPA: TlyA family rRNA (cytidine-2'-O)-methyltransferase [Erysipelotrichaceae bacterium]|nr:TlyA family rRNA (cytidine-2'-O)-methyltransferase [Erysipelotrichaceae bacterium]
MRIDLYLVDHGVYPTRNRAQEAIKQGLILINGQIIVKPSHDVSENDVVSTSDETKYVARSGNKLAMAIQESGHDFTDKNVLDLGASTGGFTQVALLRGSKHVVAVDVGSDQLEESLRNDPRVTSMENTDARELAMNPLGRHFDILLMDVSFISGRKILAALLPVLKPPLFAYVLIKPQFEVGQANVNDRGIVKNQRVVDAMLDEYRNFLKEYGCKIKSLFPCGFKGKEGNIEYFVVFEKTEIS